MRLYRNWHAICAITDPHLKLCVSLTKDESLLAKLALGFPELFTEEKPEHEGPWPLSVLRRAVKDSYDEAHDVSTANEVLTTLGFPVIQAATEPEKMEAGWTMRLSPDDEGRLWEVYDPIKRAFRVLTGGE